MSGKIDKYLIVLAVFGVIFANTALGFAQDSDFEGENVASDTEVVTIDLNSDETAPVEKPAIDEKQLFLKRLKDELNLTKADYNQVLTRVADTKERLRLVTEEKLSLSAQLVNLEDSIALTTEKLINVLKQVVEKENEISLLYEQIEMRQVALEYQKTLLRDYIRVIYEEENDYFSIGEDGTINAFKLLLADGSVGSNLRDLEYFNLLNEAGQQILARLESLTDELFSYEKILNQKRAKLIQLKESIEVEKQQLMIQKQSKENLLRLTEGKEEVYAQLFEQTAKEQEQLVNDIKNLNNSVKFIEQKMAEEGDNFNPDDYLSLLDFKTQALYNFEFYIATLSLGEFDWPLLPDLGLSAYFRDPRYVGVFGVQHNAIDLPAYQGSPVRAAADGVVYTTKDNGYGYSYIILAHAGGFMTVYGHISNILAEEGQTVTKGAVIGLSGGMPGTYGAGYMTTGPHLHFEMLLNGLYVDPLEYLSLGVLSEESMETLPEKYYAEWKSEKDFVPVTR